MRAILHRAGGKTQLTVGDAEPAVEGKVVSSAEIGFDAAEIYEFLIEHPIGNDPDLTIEELTNAFDPWLAWYGGSAQGSHAVLYGRKGDHDRRVGFRRTDGEYEVTLQFGTIENVPAHDFEPTDSSSVVVTSGSKLHAKRTFFDFCSVE